MIPLPLNAVFGLAAALLWGGGDFAGGMGVKRAGGSIAAALRVVLLSHAVSLTVLLIAATLRGDAFPRGAPLAWGLAAGLTGGFSLLLFYIALARGAMGASAAISGLLAAAIPALVSVKIDGAPSPQRLFGFAAAGLAIWLIGTGPAAGQPQDSRGTLLLAIASGAGFGVYFVALKFAGAAGVVWPMATARIASLTLCSALLLGLIARERSAHAGRTSLRLPRISVLWALGTSILDTSGNMFYLAATRAGRLDVASVLASLYPATTILLAAWTLAEAPTKRQGLGMAVAVAAVILITV